MREKLVLCLAAAMMFMPCGNAQGVLGRNLIVNGDADLGPGSDGSIAPATIPGWSVLASSPRVVAYSSGYALAANGIGPTEVGSNYFAGGPLVISPVFGPIPEAQLCQTIDVSASAAAIDTGNITFEASGYLSSGNVRFDFLDGNGRLLDYRTVGAAPASQRGLYFQRTIGPVAAGVRAVTVTLALRTGDREEFADNLSFVLSQAGDPQALFGRNILSNSGAEDGPAGTMSEVARQLPGWVRAPMVSTLTYSDPKGLVKPSDPGPAQRGATYFWGGTEPSLLDGVAYQDIDLSAAATMIDSGAVTYSASAWLGGVGNHQDMAKVEIDLKDWGGRIIGGRPLGPVRASERQGVTGLFEQTGSGNVPPGVRMAHVSIIMNRTEGDVSYAVADNASLTLSYTPPVTAPAIRPNGIASPQDFGGMPRTAPGSWLEIYGDRLASTTAKWQPSDFKNRVAPTSLGGVKVTVDNKPAFVSYVSANQVNALVPSDVGSGLIAITVTNADAGTSAPYVLMVNPLQPLLLAPQSFRVDGWQHVVAMLPDGTYVLPAGAIAGFSSRPARPGETIILYGIGFGPVIPRVDSGTIAPPATALAQTVHLQIGDIPARVDYAGLAPGFTGLYQFNVVVPDVADSDHIPVKVSIGDARDEFSRVIAVRR